MTTVRTEALVLRLVQFSMPVLVFASMTCFVARDGAAQAIRSPRVPADPRNMEHCRQMSREFHAAAVEEVAVAGLPDPDRGEVVGAFVVAVAGQDAHELETQLRDRAEQLLAPYKRPRLPCYCEPPPFSGNLRRSHGPGDRRPLAVDPR